MGYRVVEGSLFEARRLIARHRPRLLYVADPRGARHSAKVAAMARELGFPTVCVVAEGNLPEEPPPEMLWGHAGRGALTDLVLMWTVRARTTLERHYPELARVGRVVGAVGFDRYRILPLATRDELIGALRPGRRFRHVIGYAGWAFHRLEQKGPDAEAWRRRFASQLEQLARLRDEVAALLTAAAEQSPQTLFVLREHPGNVVRQPDGRLSPTDMSEIARVRELANVVRIQDELPIHDCVSGCDLWAGFESTTWLEAWLAGTPAISLEPSAIPSEVRSRLAEGCVSIRDADELIRALDGHMSGVLNYADLEMSHQHRIEEVIQWQDGRNHLRAAHEMVRLLNSFPSERPRVPGRMRVAGMTESLKLRATQRIPYLDKVVATPRLARRFSYRELKAHIKVRQPAIEAFDREHSLLKEDLEELEAINEGYG